MNLGQKLVGAYWSGSGSGPWSILRSEHQATTCSIVSKENLYAVKGDYGFDDSLDKLLEERN